MEFPPTMLCGILVDDRQECGIDFAIMMTQMPFEARFKRLNITFARSVTEAYTAFQADPGFEVLACVPSNMSNIAFLNRALLSDHGCVVGLYPVPQLDWDALEHGRPATRLQIPEAHMARPDSVGYRRLADGVYDFRTAFPECFVLKRGRERDQWTDNVERFDSAAKVEFAGCVKLRVASSPL